MSEWLAYHSVVKVHESGEGERCGRPNSGQLMMELAEQVKTYFTSFSATVRMRREFCHVMRLRGQSEFCSEVSILACN